MSIYKYIYDIHMHMSVCVKKNHACYYETMRNVNFCQACLKKKEVHMTLL